MQRRTFILAGLATLAAPAMAMAKAYIPPPRRLCLYHTHLNEYLDIEYPQDRKVMTPLLQKLNYFLRDYRTDQTCPIDPQLFYMLRDLQRYGGNNDGVFEIISAYRSPATNAMMRRDSEGVAKQSLHQEGRALDIRLRGTSTAKLRALALDMQFGGVGYYPRSDFVHIDSGEVRHW